MKSVAHTLLLLCLTFVLTSSALCEDRAISYVPGETFTVTLAPGEVPGKIALFTRSEGNEALSARLTVDGPAGVSITLKNLGFPKGASTEQMLSTSRAFDISELARPGKVTFRETSVIGDSEDPRSKKKKTKIKFICDGKIDARMQGLYEALYGFTYGYKPSMDQLCKFATGDKGSTITSPTTIKEDLRGVIFKNSCSTSLSYLVVALVDLSTVPSAIASQGFTFSFKMDLIDYNGPDNFKVKKLGEGRFKEPLLLGEGVQTDDTFPQVHRFFRYSGGKIKTDNILKPKKLAFYKNMGLIISLPRGLLTGGKAVACSSNGGAASCNCIKATAKDQLFRGYTN